MQDQGVGRQRGTEDELRLSETLKTTPQPKLPGGLIFGKHERHLRDKWPIFIKGNKGRLRATVNRCLSSILGKF